jgi:hypothetical protein
MHSSQLSIGDIREAVVQREVKIEIGLKVNFSVNKSTIITGTQVHAEIQRWVEIDRPIRLCARQDSHAWCYCLEPVGFSTVGEPSVTI